MGYFYDKGKLPVFLLFLFCVCNLFSTVYCFGQSIRPSFFIAEKWGQGGAESIGQQIDHISGVNLMDDGYIYEFTSRDENFQFCLRYKRIDFNGELIWQTDMYADSFMHQGSNYYLNNFILGSTYNTFSFSFRTFNGDGRNYRFMRLNNNNGSMISDRIYTTAEIGLYTMKKSILLMDGTLLYVGQHDYSGMLSSPGFRFVDSNNIFRSFELNSIFSNDYTQLNSIYQKTDGNLNIIYIWKEDRGPSAPGWLYSATVSIDGELIEKCSLGFHTGHEFPASECENREIQMQNGNRFLATCIDTTWNNPFYISTIHETFILNPKGEIIRRNVTPFGKDTIYRFLLIDTLSTGEIICAGEAVAAWADPLTHNKSDLFISKYDVNGYLVWNKTYKPFYFDNQQNIAILSNMRIDKDDGIILTGHITRKTWDVIHPVERFGYILKVTKDGCYEDKCGEVNFLTSTKGQEWNEDVTPFKIFPNPVREILMVELVEDRSYSISINDMNGKTIMKQQVHGDFLDLNVKNLIPGYYIFSLEHKGVRYNKQFIKLE